MIVKTKQRNEDGSSKLVTYTYVCVYIIGYM